MRAYQSYSISTGITAFVFAASSWGASIGTVAVNPASTPVSVPAFVLLTAQITDPSIIASSANVQQIDVQGRVLAVIGTMRDDGQSGDAVANDKIYSLRFTVYQEKPGPLTYRVTAGVLGSLTRVLSSPVVFNVTGLFPTGISITQPANLVFTNISPITVSGSAGDPNATVQVNSIQANKSGNNFQTTVPLQEGNNTITAVATNSNATTSTASIQVTLDTTPPHVTIDSPQDSFHTTEASVTVTGIVNDIVVGTVNAQQATVTVNGVSAQVANRTYSAMNVPLGLGVNTLQAVARDQTGNSATVSIHVTRDAVTQPYIKLISGNNQTGPVGSLLASPLIVQALNGAMPVASVPVIFKITENDGYLQPGAGKPQLISVNTNTQGRAQVSLYLGTRSGAGNNTVEAYAGGYQGTAVFTASGTPQAAAKINADSGNNQFGAVNQLLALPFVAVVTDAGHNRLQGVPVTFTVKDGGGSINGQTTSQTLTDGDGRALAVLTLGSQAGQENNVVEATFPANPGLPATFRASAKVPGNAADTTISGVVLDNSNSPIPNVTMRLFRTNQGNNNNQPMQVGTPVPTNANGYFKLTQAPVGFFKLMADGTTATGGGKSYPTLEYDIVTVAGQDNTVGMPIYLPALDPLAKVCVDAVTGGTLTLTKSPGFSLKIAAGAATFPGGSKTGCVSVTPVNPDKVPMVPGFGQQPRFVVTIQPVGTMFNPPAAISIPNVDGLAPNAKTEMYSYDHDLAAFVAIGSGTVTPDGSVIASDAGVGVLKAGWHCGGNPNVPGSAASLSLSVSPTEVKTAVGKTFSVTANGGPPRDGAYSWALVATQAGDDASAAAITSGPPCDDQPTCVGKLEAKKVGAVTLRVTFKCKTTGKDISKDVRIQVLAVDLNIDGISDATETSVGGLVVRNNDGNNAPRKKIIVMQAKPTSFTGNLILTKSSAKIKVFTAAAGGTELAFNGTDNKFANAAIPVAGKNFWVEGATESDTMRDITITLALEDDATIKDEVAFTVLWVEKPTVATSGTMSANNDKRNAYKGWTVDNTFNLGGPKRYNANFGERMGWGTEASAKVHPSKFSYPGTDLKLERDNAFHDWVGNGTSTIDQRAYSASIPPANDTGPAAARDDNPDPDDMIYDWDAPGLNVPDEPSGTIHRTRNNFKAFASITIDGTAVRCSPSQEYLVVFSMTQTAAPHGTTWVVVSPADVAGDNTAGNGSTKLTWDLK